MTSPGSRRVDLMLVDDSAVVRAGLRSLLEGERTIAIVAEAGTVKEAAEASIRIRPDVVLLDIRLPDGSGFDACRTILRRHPNARVIFLTSVADDALVEQAIRAGAHGYLLKEIDAGGLIRAIQDVAAGKSILDASVTSSVLQLVKSGGLRDPLASLSPQERRVVALIADGKTNKEIGSELGLSEKTVKNYLSRVFEKLNVSRRAQAAALYAKDQSG
jgi:two-component system, NarL family, response regulator DevR